MSNMIVLIRSQDKEKITPMRELFVYTQGSNYIGYWGKAYDEESFIDYGSYSSKEKAIKVLDMLQDFCIKINKANYGHSNSIGLYNSYDGIFQMPDDEDV